MAGEECLALARAALYGQHRRFLLDPSVSAHVGCTIMADSHELNLVHVHFKVRGAGATDMGRGGGGRKRERERGTETLGETMGSKKAAMWCCPRSHQLSC